MKKTLVFILVFLILISSSLVVFFILNILNTNKNEKDFVKTQSPQNTQIEVIPTISDTDLCKNYKAKLNLDSPVKEEEIQKVIGYKNNKVGLYVYSVEDFIRKASEMTNSNGGDWGYVLIPYNIEEYDNKKWNKIFNLLNEERLIPIIQLWGETNDYRTMEDRIKDSAEFMASLNWPIKNRYISVFNEMNDKNFWQKGIDPEGYAKFLDFTIKEYKKQSSDFFLLNGAFNTSARTNINYLSSDEYMRRMNREVPGIFGKLDGWASHPYPHVNGYLGTPDDTGRNSIRAYMWELDILEKEFGVKNIPVFITETGWPHAEGKKYNSAYLPDEVAAKYLKTAFEKVWLPDPRVVAITPFTIKYDSPHDHFSFIKENGDEYKIYKVLKDMQKIAGRPPVIKEYNPLEEYCEKINNGS